MGIMKSIGRFKITQFDSVLGEIISLYRGYDTLGIQ